MERTTSEIGIDLRSSACGEDVVGKTEAFLEEADLVKFAKFRPLKEDAARAVPQVRTLVRTLDRAQASGPDDAPRVGAGGRT